MNLAVIAEQQFVRQTFLGLFARKADPARVLAADSPPSLSRTTSTSGRI